MKAKRAWKRVRGPLAEVRRVAGAMRKAIARPALPTNVDGKVRVHLGCGSIVIPGYINVDMMPLPHVHYVGGAQELSMFDDESVDLLYACHVLEHVPRRELIVTLSEWRRVLRPGGVARISVPDFDLLLKARDAEGSIAVIQDALFGSFEHAFDVHHSAFTEESLTQLLGKSGFSSVRRWDAEREGLASYGDWSTRRIRGGRVEHFISLNLEAVK